MNRPILALFALASAAVLHAQEKPAPPKTEKTDPTPRILTFRPDAAAPTAAPSSPRGDAGVHGASVKPLLDGPAQIVATFFGSLREGKVDDGYATLTKGSKIAEKPEEIKQLKAKTHEAIEFYGAIVGYDYVESRAVGERLVRATYVSHGMIFPLRWRFYFYKPEDVWRLIDLRVDDKLVGIFDEAEEAKSLDLKSSDAPAK